MRLFLLVVLSFVGFVGCVQIDDGTIPKPEPNPVPTPDVVVPDANVDQVFLSKILTDTTITKATCMKYASLFKAFGQTFRERTDVPAMNIVKACIQTAGQFVNPPSTVVAQELQVMQSVNKDRESLATAFDKLSATCLAASQKK